MTRDPSIAAAAARHTEGAAFNGAGKINAYQCKADPAHLIVTVDREPGVTPFTVECPHCRAAGAKTPAAAGPYRYSAMTSAMYRVHPSLKPTHEWYRPDSFAGLSAGSADHVRRGGLLLRKIGEAS